MKNIKTFKLFENDNSYQIETIKKEINNLFVSLDDENLILDTTYRPKFSEISVDIYGNKRFKLINLELTDDIISFIDRANDYLKDFNYKKSHINIEYFKHNEDENLFKNDESDVEFLKSLEYVDETYNMTIKKISIEQLQEFFERKIEFTAVTTYFHLNN